MVKTEIYKRRDGQILVIYRCANEDLIGEVYIDGIEKRGCHDFRARFKAKLREAQTYRVKEYFGFNSRNSYLMWDRYADSEMNHYQVLYGLNDCDCTKVDVICTEGELEKICDALVRADSKKRGGIAICCVAKKDGNVSCRNFDLKFYDCM